MRRVIALVLAVCLLGCSTAAQEQAPTSTRLKTVKLGGATLGVGGNSVDQIVFTPIASSCSVAHLSAVWYLSEEIVVCWDKDLKESHYEVQITNAFNIAIAIAGAAGGILAAKFW